GCARSSGVAVAAALAPSVGEVAGTSIDCAGIWRGRGRHSRTHTGKPTSNPALSITQPTPLRTGTGNRAPFALAACPPALAGGTHCRDGTTALAFSTSINSGGRAGR